MVYWLWHTVEVFDTNFAVYTAEGFVVVDDEIVDTRFGQRGNLGKKQ